MKRIIIQSFIFALTISSLAINYVAIGLIANAEYHHSSWLYRVMEKGTIETFFELFLICFIPSFILYMAQKCYHYKPEFRILIKAILNK